MQWIRTAAILSAAMVSAALSASAAPPEPAHLIRVQHMPQSKILHKVMPAYPPDAVDARIQGVVKVRVMIGRDGRTQAIRLISGHPLLAPATLQAVRQWTYEPSSVEGSPVRVVTEIDIPFNLDARGKPVAPASQPGN